MSDAGFSLSEFIVKQIGRLSQRTVIEHVGPWGEKPTPEPVYHPPEKKLLYRFAEQLAARTRTMLLSHGNPGATERDGSVGCAARDSGETHPFLQHAL